MRIKESVSSLYSLFFVNQSVSATRVIKASPEKIFNLLSSPHRHTEFDGSDSIEKSLEAPARLSLGAQFSMRVHVGVSYTITITVIDFVENTSLEWTHWAKHAWRYDLKDLGDGTTSVTETWSWARSPWFVRVGLRLVKYPQRNLASIEKTLEKIASIVED